MSYHLLWWDVLLLLLLFSFGIYKTFSNEMKLIIALKFCDKIQNKYKNIIKRRITLCHTGTYIYHSHYIRMWFMWFDSFIIHQQKSLQFKFSTLICYEVLSNIDLLFQLKIQLKIRLTGHFIHTFSYFSITCSRNLKLKMIVSVINKQFYGNLSTWPLKHFPIWFWLWIRLRSRGFKFKWCTIKLKSIS